MSRPLVIGIVLGIILLAALLVAPLLRSAEQRQVEAARAQAALAERLLFSFDLALARLGARVDPAALKAQEAQYSELATRIQDELRQANQAYARQLEELRRQAAAAGLPAPEAQPVPADPAGLRRAVATYEQALRANADLLRQANQAAREARTAAGDALDVAYAAGMTEYLRAFEQMAAAHDLRTAQLVLQGRLLSLGAQWKDYQTGQDYLAGLDTREILAKLRTDLEDLRQKRAAAQQRVDELAAQVQQRAAEREQVAAELAAASKELEGLERQGFRVGDDSSFAAYRDRFNALSERARTLEAREALLRLGGREGAEIEPDQLETGEIRGGEPVVGLEELQRRLATAQQVAERQAGAVTAMEGQITFVEQAGREASQGQERYTELLDELGKQQEALLPELSRLNDQATAKEDEALKAARESAAAFAAAQQAADRFKSESARVQSERDPQRANPRLKMIAGDAALGQIGESARGAALMLLARISAQRLEAMEALIRDMKLLTELRPGATFDTAPFEERVTTARENANRALDDAAKIWDGLIRRALPNTDWVPRAALASAQHLRALVNPAEAGQHMQAALESITQAVERRERSPYLADHVLYRDYLKARVGGEAPAAEEATPEEGGGQEGESAGEKSER